MSYGAKTVQGGVNSYGDGGAEPASAVAADAAALPGPDGLTDGHVRFLVLSMVAGNTYPQAQAALNATLQLNQQPSAAAYAGWQAEVTRRAASNPPYYPAD
jgi:hypothetical protein